MAENEKQFESNIEAFLISPAGGYEKATDAGYTSSSGMALDIHTLVASVDKGIHNKTTKYGLPTY